jgi:hypothetical protein
VTIRWVLISLWQDPNRRICLHGSIEPNSRRVSPILRQLIRPLFCQVSREECLLNEPPSISLKQASQSICYLSGTMNRSRDGGDIECRHLPRIKTDAVIHVCADLHFLSHRDRKRSDGPTCSRRGLRHMFARASVQPGFTKL